MTRLFITGTGTGIGKTFVTAALAHAALEAGRSVLALKPVLSGFDADDWRTSDAGILLEAQRLPMTRENLDRIAPFRFAAPLSPDMAAVREGRTVSLDAVVEHCRAGIESTADVVLIEGVGGVCVPLNGTQTVVNWIEALGVPAVLVAGSYLGSISHTLTALAVLSHAGVTVRAIVISESAELPVPLAETAAVIARFAGDMPILTIARDARPGELAGLLQ